MVACASGFYNLQCRGPWSTGSKSAVKSTLDISPGGDKIKWNPEKATNPGNPGHFHHTMKKAIAHGQKTFHSQTV